MWKTPLDYDMIRLLYIDLDLYKLWIKMFIR